MPERTEAQEGRPPARSTPLSYVPPSARRVPRSVTWVYPPLPSSSERNRPRPGGINAGYRDLFAYEVPGAQWETRIVLLPRDPNWIFAYWEMDEGFDDRFRREHGPQVFEAGRLALRIYDVTAVEFDGTNAHRVWDLDVGQARSWYVNVGEAERDYCIDLGLLTADGRFLFIARSNLVRTPAEGFSSLTDDEWLTLDEIYFRSLGLEGSESSAALVRVASRRLQELVSSPGISSLMSPFGGVVTEMRPFWLNVGAELILYGSTEPGAHLEVDGKPVTVGPDGCFSLRVAFPDGELRLPVVGRSVHTGEEHGATLLFRRETATR